MSDKTGKILIIDDNEDLLRAAKIFLKRHFLQVNTETNPENIPTLMDEETYDVILLDMNFTKDVSSGSEGFYWLDQILKKDPTAVVVLITAYGDVSMAVKAVKEGATDFVLKPWENEKLLATIHSAYQLRQSKYEISVLKSRQEQMDKDLDSRFHEILGKSDAMMKVFHTIDRVSQTDANVLILGENGTGKELVARALHRSSPRANKPFVSVDLGSISSNLFESELFGHTKGSFTDARDDRMGRFEVANGGTLFLDEIGNLSTPLQAKLLTAIQSRKITRVGSNKVMDVDIRLICATNMPIYEMAEQGTFRQDLIYRVNTIELQLPPLRQRGEDVIVLAEHFTRFFARKYNKNISTLSPAAHKTLQNYPWPGNVRELEHAVERAVIMSNSNTLMPEDFYFNKPASEARKDPVDLDDLNIEEVEKILIKKALKKFDGNITRASQELGLTRSSLYRRLEKYDL